MGSPNNTKKPRPKPGSQKPGAQGATAKSASANGTTSTKAPAEGRASPPAVTVKSAAKPAAPVEKPAPPIRQVSKQEQKRDARREDIRSKLEVRKQQQAAELRRQRNKKVLIWGGGATVVVALAAFLFYNIFLGPSVAAYLKGDTIDGVQCNTLEQTVSHYHAHLQIYVNGQPAQIPIDVGRQAPNCFYWLHTHDPAGIPGDAGDIHIEAPANTSFHLFQFFDIWGQTWNATSFMGNKLDASHTLTVYVYTPDATQTPSAQGTFTSTPPPDLKPYTGDPRQITLAAHQIIYVEYGTPIVPPQAFTFPTGE